MILVGPSLGSAVAIHFAVKLSRSQGTGNLATLPRAAAYAGAYLLKSLPIRLYATYLAFSDISFNTSLDWINVGRLHLDFMIGGGYNVASLIGKVKPKTLIIWGENDRIINNKLAVIRKISPVLTARAALLKKCTTQPPCLRSPPPQLSPWISFPRSK
ncbi:hypothetical protein K1719_004202 [Acacia pycnantha]|nr:hypothetical protein K1719_004202 [Acacia pycnantha]